MTDNNEGWISVKDRLPEMGHFILFFSWRGVRIGSFWPHDRTYKITDTGFELPDKEVTHWMPLPSPPRTKE